MIGRYFRDPTLDAPADSFFEMHLVPFSRILLDRQEAQRVIAAFVDPHGPEVLRCQDVTGSVIYLRTREIRSIRESTPEQRDAQRRFWKKLDDEDEDEDANENEY